MREPEVPDHYYVLGIDPEANDTKIRKAFRSKALKAHPDHGGSEEAMKQLNQSHGVLMDAGQKYDYDTDYPALKRKWQRYRVWKAKVDSGTLPSKPTPKSKTKTSKATASKAKNAKTKTSKKKKPKPKKVKAKQGVVKRETEKEDIGPLFKVKCGGVELTLEEHARICGCKLFSYYKDNPEVVYTYQEEEDVDDEYRPEN